MVKSLGGFGTPQPGSQPEADLIQVGSKLYGTTNAGGAYGNGTIFSLDLNTSRAELFVQFRLGCQRRFEAAWKSLAGWQRVIWNHN